MGRVGMGRNLEGLYKTIKVCLLAIVDDLCRMFQADKSAAGLAKAARPESDVYERFQIGSFDNIRERERDRGGGSRRKRRYG